MQLQNSYIFLSTPKNTLSKSWRHDEIMEIDIGHSFMVRLKKAFPNMGKSEELDNFFKHKYTFCIERESNAFEVIFTINVVLETYYLDVTVSGKRKAQIIECLEYIQTTLDKSDIEDYYTQIVSYDAVSEYYCNRIYPELNRLERNLRKLLFSIYIANFGREYYQATISTELQTKAKGIIQAKGNAEAKEIARLKNFFYSLEFNDIQELLFKPRWTDIDEQKKADFLETHKDLSKLSDGELRKAFSETAPKSDWDRFFVDKMSHVDVQFLISELRKSRNNIAHCKFFYKPEYDACRKVIDKLNRAINLAITITENQDFINKNSESLRMAFSRRIEIFETIARITEKVNALNLLTSFQAHLEDHITEYAEV